MNEKKIELARGSPKLNWIGKQGVGKVRSFPVQLVQINDPSYSIESADLINYEHIKDSWFNLIFHGDNKEIMATLLEKGFRGKIDLVYIDPPFKSGSDYVRRVALRGQNNTQQIEQEEASVVQQTMYFDIWNNDNYLQFMYERLILIKELLSETGNFFLHLDWRMSHYLRIILDEIFGRENFRNEIIWFYPDTPGRTINYFPRKHDTIFWYSKTSDYFFNADSVRIPILEASKKRYESPRSLGGHSYVGGDSASIGKVPEDVWRIPSVKGTTAESTSFVTQKPEKLVNRIIEACSKPNDIIADFFAGSGTTLASAQKLKRKWICSDINRGSIHIISKRIQDIINNQDLKDKNQITYYAIYKVNDYDLKLLRTEAIELAMSHVGVQKNTSDSFFEGTIGENTIVKLIELNHPLTLLDLSLIKEELYNRPSENRDITIICLGKESSVDHWIEEWNKKQPFSNVKRKIRSRQLKVIELRTDSRYGKFFIHKPSSVKIKIDWIDKKNISIKIINFISPTVLERFGQENRIFQPKIKDFRSMVDSVFIDTNYDGKIFRAIVSDIPGKQNEMIKGEYIVNIPHNSKKIALKIFDVLGEEILIVEDLFTE